MKRTLVVLGGLVAVAALVAAVWAASYALGIVGNKTQASYNKRVVTSKIQQQINTADFAQQTYEQFYNECNKVVALNAQIAQLKERLAEAKQLPNDATKSQQVGAAITDLTGAEALQTQIAADYNAQSEQWTRAAFKDANLPARLDPPYDVSCG
jgi:hypothetical protein